MKHIFCLMALVSAVLLSACGGSVSSDTPSSAANSLTQPVIQQEDDSNDAKATSLASTGGFSTAKGSTNAAVKVTTLSELQAAFSAGKHHILVSGRIYGGPTLTTLTFASTDWNNTTIEGEAGGTAVLENVQLKFSGELLPMGLNIQNIVVKNITFHGNIADLQALPQQAYNTSNKAGVNYLGVSLRRVTNAWIDHCTFYDLSDDLMSVTLASDNVTVSYNHFYFTDAWVRMNPDPLWNWVGNFQDLANERLAMVIGANPSDSYTYGSKALHVTLHHNQFGPNIKGRPLVRGWIHAYNNYFDNSTQPTGLTSAGAGASQYNAFQIGSGSVVYSEANYYFKTNQSNQIGLDSSTDTYSFFERGNQYDTVTGTRATGDALSNVPVNYSYSLDSVASIPKAIQGKIGPR